MEDQCWRSLVLRFLSLPLLGFGIGFMKNFKKILDKVSKLCYIIIVN